MASPLVWGSMAFSTPNCGYTSFAISRSRGPASCLHAVLSAAAQNLLFSSLASKTPLPASSDGHTASPYSMPFDVKNRRYPDDVDCCLPSSLRLRGDPKAGDILHRCAPRVSSTAPARQYLPVVIAQTLSGRFGWLRAIEALVIHHRVCEVVHRALTAHQCLLRGFLHATCRSLSCTFILFQQQHAASALTRSQLL